MSNNTILMFLVRYILPDVSVVGDGMGAKAKATLTETAKSSQ